LYERGTWCLALREHILKVCENRVVSRKLGLKRDEIAGNFILRHVASFALINLCKVENYWVNYVYNFAVQYYLEWSH
jgi:hypothetical protein